MPGGIPAFHVATVATSLSSCTHRVVGGEVILPSLLQAAKDHYSRVDGHGAELAIRSEEQVLVLEFSCKTIHSWSNRPVSGTRFIWLAQPLPMWFLFTADLEDFTWLHPLDPKAGTMASLQHLDWKFSILS
jgi:hypothetical protein